MDNFSKKLIIIEGKSKGRRNLAFFKIIKNKARII